MTGKSRCPHPVDGCDKTQSLFLIVESLTRCVLRVRFRLKTGGSSSGKQWPPVGTPQAVTTGGHAAGNVLKGVPWHLHRVSSSRCVCVYANACTICVISPGYLHYLGSSCYRPRSVGNQDCVLDVLQDHFGEQPLRLELDFEEVKQSIDTVPSF